MGVQMTEKELKPGRPLGISIFAWLDIIGGVLGVPITAFVVFFFAKSINGRHFLAGLGISPELLFVYLMVLCVLAIASGVGMWSGKRWGWYLGSFFCVYNIVRDVNALIRITAAMNAMSREDVAGMSHGPGFFYVKFGVRIILGILMYLYFFKANVRAHFGLSETKKWKPVATQTAICAAILLLLTAISRWTR